MRRNRFTSLIVSLLCAFLLAAPAAAEEEPAWRFELTPYLWLISVDADSTVGSYTANVDTSFRDIWDNFDVLAGAARFEAWRGKWGFIFDGIYIKVSQDATVQTQDYGDVEAKPDVRLNFIELAAAYEAYSTDLSAKGKGPRLSLQPYVGVRYSYLKEELNLQPAGGGDSQNVGGSTDWWDPLVGGRVVLSFNEAWQLGLRGDIGGFGIGDAAELTWQVALGANWRFVDWAALRFGYQWYYTDYSNGESGTNALAFDGSLHGPWLGLTFYF